MVRFIQWVKGHRRELLVLLIFTLVGGFLRFHNLTPWLHFELDQSRDAIVIDRALDGSILDLPLLGPKAGGTFLRLGPAFYYLEYLSAQIFGKDAVGQMMIITVLGTLLIPLFYFFLRRAFSVVVSFFGTAWLTVSLYAILYSRFGWNPNLLPFFTLAGFFGLLIAVDSEASDRQRKYAFLAAAFLLALATQMHFLAFLAVPVITVLFLLYKRPKFALTTWLGGLLIVGVLYLPMVLNETKTGFANTTEFFGAITEKSTKEEHPFLEKFIRNTAEYGLAEVVVLTSFEGAMFPKIDTKGFWVTSIVCEGRCDAGKWYGVFGVLFFILTFLGLLYAAYKATGRQKDFFVLAVLWQTVAFVLFIPLSFGIAPRFYLLTLPLFFVSALAFFHLFFSYLKGYWRIVAVCGLGLVIVSVNAYFIHQRFQELAESRYMAIATEPDRILKEKTRVTYAQKQDIVTAILALPGITEKPLYFESTSQYKRAFKYLLKKQTIPTDGISPDEVYKEGVYVYVFRTQSDINSVLGRILESFTVTEKNVFGTLTMIVLTPKPEAITADRQVIVPPASVTSNSAAPKRYTWREYLSDGTGQSEEIEETAEEDSEE